MPNKEDTPGQRARDNTFAALKPESKKLVAELIAAHAKTKDEKKPELQVDGNANSLPTKLPKQADLTVKLIVVDEKICFIMNKPVDWLGFDREAAEEVGKQLIALARGTE